MTRGSSGPTRPPDPSPRRSTKPASATRPRFGSESSSSGCSTGSGATFGRSPPTRVSIVGDATPIYVALDSADVWANPEAFRLDEGNRPRSSRASRRTRATTGSAGGNRLRLGSACRARLRLVDRPVPATVRTRRRGPTRPLPRVREVLGDPADADDPAAGEWCEGPGRDLFETVERELGQAPFIAEDLGFEEPAMDELMVEFGFPGMRVPQYADWCAEGNQYQPMHYPEGVVGYVDPRHGHVGRLLRGSARAPALLSGTTSAPTATAHRSGRSSTRCGPRRRCWR